MVTKETQLELERQWHCQLSVNLKGRELFSFDLNQVPFGCNALFPDFPINFSLERSIFKSLISLLSLTSFEIYEEYSDANHFSKFYGRISGEDFYLDSFAAMRCRCDVDSDIATVSVRDSTDGRCDVAAI